MPDPTGSRPDRNLALELVRVTEYGALAAARWVGLGEKEAADQAAVDAMRHMLETVQMDGIVVIGEGEKDEAPMLYNGEHIGDGSPPEVDIAVDPLEGTTLAAEGSPRALAVIALSERRTMFDPGPCVYMMKIAAQQGFAHLLDLDEVLDVNRVVSGNDVFFAATGVTDGDVLDGVHYTRGGASTESLVMRSRSGTVRRVSARHDRAKLREISGERVW